MQFRFRYQAVLVCLVCLSSVALLNIACQSMNRGFLATPKDIGSEPPRHSAKKNLAIPGKYLGFLRLKDRGFKLPMQLDLLMSKSRREIVEYQTISKFSLGSFESAEYFGEFHSSVQFDPGKAKFFFPENPSPIQLSDVALKAGSGISGKVLLSEGREELGDFLVIYSGRRRNYDVANFINKIFPDQEILPNIGGEYSGACDGQTAHLSLVAGRWSKPSSLRREKLTNSEKIFSGLRISGAFAKTDKTFCVDKEIPCLKNRISDVRMDLAKAELKLSGEPLTEICSFESKKSLKCGLCQFSKAGTEIPIAIEVKRQMERATRRHEIILSEDRKLVRNPSFPGSVEGEYFGYVFHETTLNYQLLRLKVNAELVKTEGMKKPALQISGVSTLFFGAPEANEFIVYRFESDFYSNSAPYFIFGGKGEAFLQVSQWNEDGLKGIWYSKTFGRVGTVELRKSQIPVPEASLASIQSVTGSYNSATSRINAIAQSGLSLDETDFFPILVKGIALKKDEKNQRELINMMSYDFYQNRVLFELQDGRLVEGQFDDQGMKVSWRDAIQFGASLTPAREEKFTYERDPFSGTTAFQMYDLLETTNPSGQKLNR